MILPSTSSLLRPLPAAYVLTAPSFQEAVLLTTAGRRTAAGLETTAEPKDRIAAGAAVRRAATAAVRARAVRNMMISALMLLLNHGAVECVQERKRRIEGGRGSIAADAIGR